jgi:hypothetical protein
MSVVWRAEGTVEGKVDKSTQLAAWARLIKRNVGSLICCLRKDSRGDVSARPVASREPGDATLGSAPLERRHPVRRVGFPVQPC